MRISEVLIDGFDEAYRRFRSISAGARERFESADWSAVQRAVRERIRLEDVAGDAVDRSGAERADGWASLPVRVGVHADTVGE